MITDQGQSLLGLPLICDHRFYLIQVLNGVINAYFRFVVLIMRIVPAALNPCETAALHIAA